MASTRHFPGMADKLAAPAGMAAYGSTPELAARERLLIWCCLAAIVALAWLFLLLLDQRMAAGMAAESHSGMAMAGMAMRWTPADFLLTAAMWIVMMTGMMAGSAAPVVLLFASALARRAQPHLRRAVASFVCGYLLVWSGFGLIATFMQWHLHEAALLSPAMALSNRALAAGVLCLAGIYQMTPLKQSCLRHCQSPLGFLLSHWRDGMSGALQMGLRHGLYCLGCCWALMAVLFVVGVMNLAWVAALAIIVLLEKLLPAGVVLARATGVMLIIAGGLVWRASF